MKNLRLYNARQRLASFHSVLPKRSAGLARAAVDDVAVESFGEGYRRGLEIGMARGKRDERNRRAKAYGLNKDDLADALVRKRVRQFYGESE
jgi:hypothetical protein